MILFAMAFHSAIRCVDRSCSWSTPMVLRILWNTAAGLLERHVNRNLRKSQILQPFVWRGRPGLLDCDVNLHLSNSSYFYAMDLARWRFSTQHGFLQYTLRNRCMVMIASQCIRLRHPIAPFQPYEIHSQMCYWDDDWVYFLHHFCDPTSGKIYAEGIARLAVVRLGGKGRVSPHAILQGMDIPGFERPQQMPEIVKGLVQYDHVARTSMDHAQTRRGHQLHQERGHQPELTKVAMAQPSSQTTQVGDDDPRRPRGLLRFFTASVNWPLN